MRNRRGKVGTARTTHLALVSGTVTVHGKAHAVVLQVLVRKANASTNRDLSHAAQAKRPTANQEEKEKEEG